MSKKQSDSESLLWRFDPVPPSGAIRKGIPVSYVFDADLKTFVREVLQNSHDQRTPEAVEVGHPVEVDFDLISLTGEHLTRFLDALRWDDLRTHLVASQERYNLTGSRIQEALGAVESGLLRLLRVSDYNTMGLVGEEDANGQNYKALVRNVLDTTDEKATRGGSHGLGKAVLWAFSSAATVLFSSLVADGSGEVGLRLVGRTDLPYHATSDGQWDGSGWLGAPDEDPAKLRVVSVWDAPTAAADLMLARDPARGTGTSILVVGFYEPDREGDLDASSLLGDIASETSRNFWPALVAGTLQVRVRSFVNDRKHSDELIGAGPDVAPFVEAIRSGSAGATAAAPGEVAEDLVPIRIPGQPGTDEKPPTPEIETTAELRVLAADPNRADHALRNRIALVRGAGMVVEYWKPPREPLGGSGFFGVLRAGQALGNEQADRALEEFLRASEPPAHNEWKGNTNRIRNEYKAGGQARLREFFSATGKALIRMCEVSAPPESDGPERLKKLFRLNTPGDGPVRQSFKATYRDAEKRGDEWWLAADVRRTKGFGPWTAAIHVLLDGESGRGQKLPLVGLDLPLGTSAEALIDGDEAVISVPAGADDTSFEVRASLAALDPSVADRTRVRLSIRAKSGRVGA